MSLNLSNREIVIIILAISFALLSGVLGGVTYKINDDYEGKLKEILYWEEQYHTAKADYDSLGVLYQKQEMVLNMTIQGSQEQADKVSDIIMTQKNYLDTVSQSEFDSLKNIYLETISQP